MSPTARSGSPTAHSGSPDPEQQMNGDQPQTYTVAGNINEALDIFAEDIKLPQISEGDYLAFLNAGSYGAALSSNHCMRGHYSEYVLFDEKKLNLS